MQELAGDFGWRRKMSFSKVALHFGVLALMTLTAAARLMCAMETNGINNVLNNKEHDDLAYALTRENLQY